MPLSFHNLNFLKVIPLKKQNSQNIIEKIQKTSEKKMVYFKIIKQNIQFYNTVKIYLKYSKKVLTNMGKEAIIKTTKRNQKVRDNINPIFKN